MAAGNPDYDDVVALPPPAWHPDPKGEARPRYWDGDHWTGHTAA